MTDTNGNRNGQPQIPGDAPAFPVSVSGCGDNGWHGMSLRDWFAGQALSSMVETNPRYRRTNAEAAYAMADEMLKVRAEPKNGSDR